MAAALVLGAATVLGPSEETNMSARSDPTVHRAVAPGSPTVEDEVLGVVRAWNAAFADNDLERYFSFVHPDVTVLTPDNPYRVEGIEQDRVEFAYGLRTGRTRVNLFQMMQPRVQVHENSAVVTYFWRGSLGQDPTVLVAFKETNVFIRTAEQWKLLHVHLSRASG